MAKNLITDINRMKGMMGLSEITFRELEGSSGDDGEVRKIPKSRAILALKWLNKKYGDLRKVYNDSEETKTRHLGPKSKTLYVDKNGLPLFYFDSKVSKNVYINDKRIWLLFESIFGMNELQTKHILKVWLQQTYNLSPSFTPTNEEDPNPISSWEKPYL